MDARAAMFLVSAHIAAIDHVKDLKEDKGVEAERITCHLISIVDRWFIVVVSEIKETSICTHDDHHDNNHADCAAKNLAVHMRRHDGALSSLVMRDVGRWFCRG